MASPYDHNPPPHNRGEYGGSQFMGDDQMNNYAPDPRARTPQWGNADAHLPPPPLGEEAAPKPALKRQGSRSRLPPDMGPSFPDEASYLGANAPDLERKNRPRDRAFRDLRDGYESDEGEAHRRMARDGRRGEDGMGGQSRRRGGRDRPPYPPDDSQLSRNRPDPRYDPPQHRRSRREPYYDDDDRPPRDRRDHARLPPEVEYGSDPIPARRRSERRPRRRDEYNSSEDDDDRYGPPARRHRSHEDHRRPPPRRDDDYYSDEPRRRRDRDDYGGPRRDRSRRRYDDDDYDDDYDRRDRNKRRDRESRLPKEMKIGGFDVGPLLQKGQQHWTTVAPIVTPFVLNYARKHFMGGGGGSSGRR